jgi:hypothetical protein
MKDVIETKTCMGLRSHDTERRGCEGRKWDRK